MPGAYSYQTSRELLIERFQQLKKSKSGFSLRAWAKYLGYTHPMTLQRVLRGERSISFKDAKKISSKLGLKPDEQKFFELLVVRDGTRDDESRARLTESLDEIRDHQTRQTLEQELFESISQWFHTAILELTARKNFKNDPAYIAKSLRDKISIGEASQAIQKLIKIGLVEETNGSTKRRPKTGLAIGKNLPSKAMRAFHKQMLSLGVESIEEQAIDERFITSNTLPIAKQDYLKIVEFIQGLHQKASKLAKTENAEAIYQLNVQLFRLDQEVE